MYTILVIDDNKTNLQLVRGILSEKYTILPALSGAMALRYAEKKAIDLMLLDFVMSEMDGGETLRALRHIPTCSTVPVIFLTADSSRETEIECLRLGACDFTTKPFVPEVLLTRIERTLELESYHKDLQDCLRAKTVELENVVLQIGNTMVSTLVLHSRNNSTVKRCNTSRCPRGQRGGKAAVSKPKTTFFGEAIFRKILS